MTDDEKQAIFAGRINVLFFLGRPYLSLPFAVLCFPTFVLAGKAPSFLLLTPILLQLAVVIVAERLADAYKKRPPGSDPAYWAKRYVFVSAIAGATWGVGTLFWFVPNSFPAQAYLSLAFLGMTATEFIARSAHRPAYLTHAMLSLGPLVVLLLLQSGFYAVMTAVIVVLFAGVLYSYCGGITRLLDESLRLRRENSGLVLRLSQEKHEAELARDAAQAESAFISNIGAELRTPLNTLLDMAQLLDRAGLERPHCDRAKTLLDCGRDLQTLLSEVIAQPGPNNDDTHVRDDIEDAPQESAAAVDPDTFAALEKSVGIETLVEILKSYIETTERLCKELGLASEQDDWQEAGKLAQDIAGSASGFGLSAMTAAARSFSKAARDGAPPQHLRTTAQIIAREHDRVRRALVHLYPKLAA